MRERVAIVFMTLNVVATLALGGAIAYAFAHPGHATDSQPVTGSVAGQSYTAAPAAGSGTATPTSSAASAPVTQAPSGGGTPGAHMASSVAPPSGHTASAPKTTAPTKTHAAAKTHSGGKAPPTTTTTSTTPTSTTSSAPPNANHGVLTVGGIYDETGPVDATVERDTVRSYFNLVNAQEIGRAHV